MRLTFIFLIALFGYSSAQVAVSSFEYHNGIIFFEVVESTGDTLLCLFDTGAQRSAIDAQKSDELELNFLDSVQVVGTDTTMSFTLVRLPGLKLHSFKRDSLAPVRRDLSYSLSLPSKRLDMILGYDFFKDMIVEIDFKEKKIRLYAENNGLKYKDTVPFVLDSNIPRFTVATGKGIQLDLRLDTGASLFETDDIYINITAKDWDRIKALEPGLLPVFYLSGNGIGNQPIQLPVVKLENIKFGNLEFHDPYVIIQPAQGYFALDHAVGFVSNNLLCKFNKVAIDYKHQLLLISE